jgi:hypothetical protein
MSNRAHAGSRFSMLLPATVLAVAAGFGSSQTLAASAADAPSIPWSGQPPAATFSARALAAQAKTELLAGHPGPAILHYERAQLLAPRAPVIAGGLAEARAAAGVNVPLPSLWHRVEHRLGPTEWGWVGMAGLVAIAAAIIALAWGVLRRRGSTVLALAGAALSVLGFLAAVQETPPAERAVVIAPNVTARIAPFDAADPAFFAPEGAVLMVERTHGGYALVAGAEGSGWVPLRDVATILPPAHRRL